MEGYRLQWIVDLDVDVAAVASALAGGVDVVQLRDKRAAARQLFARAEALKPLVHRHGAKLFLNDRVDVALAVGADGVHLAQRSLPPEVVRRIAPGLLVGLSVHDPEEVERLSPFVDYVTFGHVFPTESHPGLPPKGLPGLKEAVARSACPVYAIGGISAANVGAVLRAGARGVVVLSAIRRESERTEEAARRLRQAIDESLGAGRGSGR